MPDQTSLTRRAALGGLVAFATLTRPAWADAIDRPTLVSDKPLNGSSEVEGSVTLSRGFPYHRYTAQTDGFVRFVMETTNLPNRPNDNEGTAWRPYLRIISVSNEHRHAEAWSTNGHQEEVDTGRAELVLRVRAGEQFDVITTLAQNFVRKRPDARANYRLVVTEVAL
jgi:hypothetical protein